MPTEVRKMPKSIGYWSGVAFIGLAILLAISDLTLLRVLLPFRAVVVGSTLIGTVLCTWSGYRSKQKAISAAAIGLLLLTWQLKTYYFSYREEPVTFSSQGVLLSGTLYLPKQGGQFPAIVIVHGSGKMPRSFYHYWADHWVRRGYAVLSYDKRGTGRSGGEYEGNNNTSRKNIDLLAN